MTCDDCFYNDDAFCDKYGINIIDDTKEYDCYEQVKEERGDIDD